MEDRVNPQIYYIIYNIFRDKLRCKSSVVAKELGHTGRGRSKKTVSKYILRMYDKQISFRPNLILRTFDNSRLTAFFLNVKNPGDVSNVFQDLSNSQDISYLLLLSGRYDFFLTTRNQKFRPNSMARIAKKVQLFTPIYTVPKGWNLGVNEVLRKQFAYSKPQEGKIRRTVEDFLYWDQVHFDIFKAMMYNAHMPFTTVAKMSEISANTVKKYFYESVLPSCDVAHYFFPKGYDHYSQSLILLDSDYEIGLVNLFSMLPCTTYIFPFEEEIGVLTFHEGVQELLFALKKLEERGYLGEHMLLTPLHWE